MFGEQRCADASARSGSFTVGPGYAKRLRWLWWEYVGAFVRGRTAGGEEALMSQWRLSVVSLHGLAVLAMDERRLLWCRLSAPLLDGVHDGRCLQAVHGVGRCVWIGSISLEQTLLGGDLLELGRLACHDQRAHAG